MAAGAEIVQGTLDMLVLKAVSGSPQHGYNILEWLRRCTVNKLQIEDAALYPALHRLEARRLIESEWGLSDNNRRAKFYLLTAAGRRALRAERDSWQRYIELVAKVMNAPAPRTA